ncbi:MAG: BACON domain-containing protein, partial [Blastocatellia bacterium]
MRNPIRLAARLSFFCVFIGLLAGVAAFRSHSQENLSQSRSSGNLTIRFGEAPLRGDRSLAGEANGDGLPTEPAQAVTVIDHTMSGAPFSTTCVTPPPKFNFATTDARAYQWTRFSSVRIGDVVRGDVIQPDGSNYDSTQATFDFNGNNCVWAEFELDIAGTPVASLPGNWQIRIFFNGALVLTESFTIGPQSIRVLNHKMTGGPIPTNCATPAPKFNFASTDARAYQWTFYAGARAGDFVKVDYIRPDGTLYYSDQGNLNNSGNVCVFSWIDIAGQLAASLPGNWQARVFYGSTQVLTEDFTITNPNQPGPVLTALSPNSAVAGGPRFTLMASGSGFVVGSVVQWNGAARTTTYVSSTQLLAAISASDVATAGTASVTVLNPPPGGGVSNALGFTINPAIVCPIISGLNPASGMVGSQVTITGANFTGVSAVRFTNNIAAQFTVNSNAQIIATVPNGAVTGPITISKPNCPDATTDVFTVAGCNYSINPASQSFPASGGSGSATVSTQANCSWTAMSNDAWIRITSGGMGTGNGAVNFSVEANTGPNLRSGSIRIAGLTFTIIQAGVTQPPSGGAVIIDGTNANRYGSASGNANRNGWLYMQKALENLAARVSPGTARVVVDLGASSGDARDAINSAFNLSSLPAAGWTLKHEDGAANITNWLTNLSTANTGILYITTYN